MNFRLLTVSRRDSCGVQRATDLAPHPVVGLRLQDGHAEKFAQAPGPEKLELFVRVSKLGPWLTAIVEMETTTDMYSLNLLVKLRVLFYQALVNLATAAIRSCLIWQSLPSAPV